MSIKFRASSLGRLMTDDPSAKISQKQLVTLNDLLTKIKLTEKQSELRDKLIDKRDAKPSLSKGAKTYIKEVWLYENFGIKQEINSKYLVKGNKQEDLSIQLVSELLDMEGLEKNESEYENDHIKGTPDVITEDLIIDVKTSWSASTFPFFDETLTNSIYEWQLKAYMWLTGRVQSYLCYCLVPTPETLILDEIRRISWKRGEGYSVSKSVEKEVRDYFDITSIPVIDRLKVFEVTLTDSDIVKMLNKVSLAREYYKTITK